MQYTRESSLRATRTRSNGTASKNLSVCQSPSKQLPYW